VKGAIVSVPNSCVGLKHTALYGSTLQPWGNGQYSLEWAALLVQVLGLVLADVLVQVSDSAIYIYIYIYIYICVCVCNHIWMIQIHAYIHVSNSKIHKGLRHCSGTAAVGGANSTDYLHTWIGVVNGLTGGQDLPQAVQGMCVCVCVTRLTGKSMVTSLAIST
jgi:hypothetical protein